MGVNPLAIGAEEPRRGGRPPRHGAPPVSWGAGEREGAANPSPRAFGNAKLLKAPAALPALVVPVGGVRQASRPVPCRRTRALPRLDVALVVENCAVGVNLRARHGDRRVRRVQTQGETHVLRSDPEAQLLDCGRVGVGRRQLRGIPSRSPSPTAIRSEHPGGHRHGDHKAGASDQKAQENDQKAQWIDQKAQENDQKVRARRTRQAAREAPDARPR